jgi:hypothetical protein
MNRAKIEVLQGLTTQRMMAALKICVEMIEELLMQCRICCGSAGLKE